MRIHSCHVSHDRSPIYAVVSCLSPERGVLSAENRPCHQRAVPCQAIAIPRRVLCPGLWTSDLVSHTSLSDFPVTHLSFFLISVVYMGYGVMRYCWWQAVLRIGGDWCHNVLDLISKSLDSSSNSVSYVEETLNVPRIVTLLDPLSDQRHSLPDRFPHSNAGSYRFVLLTIHLSGKLAVLRSCDRAWSVINDMPSPYDDVIVFDGLDMYLSMEEADGDPGFAEEVYEHQAVLMNERTHQLLLCFLFVVEALFSSVRMNWVGCKVETWECLFSEMVHQHPEYTNLFWPPPYWVTSHESGEDHTGETSSRPVIV
ncbi:unnamed protein product [Brassica oleracea var. botrytis]